MATRVYPIYRPSSARDRAPAVVVLHDGSQSMTKICGDRGGANVAWVNIAEREGVVLIAPNGTNSRTSSGEGDRQSWNDYRHAAPHARVDDVACLRRAVEDVTHAQRLDLKRIFIAGASNGGMVTFRMLI